MKTPVFFLMTALVFFSCEKEPDTELPADYGYVPGVVGVSLIQHASLKSAFDLADKFQLEIGYEDNIFYASKLPADSLDYVTDVLKSKSYLNNDRWRVRDGDVYISNYTGKITLAITMMNMDEYRRNDWDITAAILGLVEQPAEKSFLLKVPEGEEISWRDKLRAEYIVNSAYLVYLIANY